MALAASICVRSETGARGDVCGDVRDEGDSEGEPLLLFSCATANASVSNTRKYKRTRTHMPSDHWQRTHQRVPGMIGAEMGLDWGGEKVGPGPLLALMLIPGGVCSCLPSCDEGGGGSGGFHSVMCRGGLTGDAFDADSANAEPATGLLESDECPLTPAPARQCKRSHERLCARMHACHIAVALGHWLRLKGVHVSVMRVRIMCQCQSHMIRWSLSALGLFCEHVCAAYLVHASTPPSCPTAHVA